MKEVFKYYLNNCSQASIYENNLTFEFGHFHITYAIKNGTFIENDLLTTIFSFDDIEDILQQNPIFTICSIGSYEYLGWRADLEEGRSISNEAFFCIKSLNEYNRNIVDNFYIEIDYGDAMCDSHGNYNFDILINEKYWSDLSLAKYIVETLKPIEVSIPTFYTKFFNNNKKLNDSGEVPILSTNTKVRRIGYFKILSTFFTTFTKIPYSSINKKFEDYCLDYKDILNLSKFKKGVIDKSSNGISAKPYVEIAIDLSILNKINNIIHIGKPFKVYQVLQKEFSKQPNPFELSDFDKLYFLESILRNDYFYFSNLLELFFFEEKMTYQNLLPKFQGVLRTSLEKYKNQTISSDRKVLVNVETILKRINSWEKPEIYLEHLIMPRINWMLDLGILFEGDKEYAITETGKKLFQNFLIWNDINTEKIISPIAFLDRFMVHVFDYCYKGNKTSENYETKFILEKMYSYIDESFSLFKTLAPNRVTASQAANYAKYKLYFNNNIKIGYQFVLNSLLEHQQDDIFIFKFQEQYKDGYIQKKY